MRFRSLLTSNAHPSGDSHESPTEIARSESPASEPSNINTHDSIITGAGQHPSGDNGLAMEQPAYNSGTSKIDSRHATLVPADVVWMGRGAATEPQRTTNVSDPRLSASQSQLVTKRDHGL